MVRKVEPAFFSLVAVETGHPPPFSRGLAVHVHMPFAGMAVHLDGTGRGVGQNAACLSPWSERSLPQSVELRVLRGPTCRQLTFFGEGFSAEPQQSRWKVACRSPRVKDLRTQRARGGAYEPNGRRADNRS